MFGLADILSLTLSFKGFKNVFYSSVTLQEYLLFALFLYYSIKTKNAKKAILVLSLLFIAFLAVYTFTAKFVRIDSIPIGVETILILIFSFYYLYEEMNNTSVLFLYNKYQFWVVIAFMIYLSGCFFMYIFANQLPQQMVNEYWFIIDIFLILKNVLFSIAILVFALSRNEKTPPRIHQIKALT
ncbi:hypothetical protein [Paracnuella aquatica]|uniref:hypothetical protein n=1 Tax=Paracnuella aquatica TaxID=2268757 RepID=UPI000DEF925B|nr:hypothetical protein [Paracnuella aquatica]RPD48970.1 hypothetical protein DRJ53_09940 [Paracnuella aquatica]